MGNAAEKYDSPSGTVQQDLLVEDKPMAACEHAEHGNGGYEDERFKDPVSENYHCAICTNVFKDPVMCYQNEHIFCRACITKYLARFQRCPSCMEPLTVDTLRVPPRIVLSCLSEFKIRCDFHDRGCRQIVQLGKLEGHVKECGYAPAVCSNEGCQIEVNARDLIHHETTVCEKRRVQCHNCAEFKHEMEAMKEKLTTASKKLDGIEAKQEKLIADVNDKLGKLEADNEEIKQNLSVVVEHLGRRSKGPSHEASANSASQNERQRSSVASKGVKTSIVVAGGSRTVGKSHEYLNSVEMFDTTEETWTILQPMRECRKNASSVVYNNQIIVSGGFSKTGVTKSMEALPNADQLTQSVTWNGFPAVLPERTYGHSSVVYNDQLITVGGYAVDDNDAYDISKRINDVSLTPPYSLKRLTYMRYKRMSLRIHLFDDKLVVVGGETFYNALDSVLLYDLVKNESKELAPLPYPVSEMASVSWGENILIIGGAGYWQAYPTRALQILDSVVLYNVRTQTSRMMRKMKYKRRGAAAVMIGKCVYVMGGTDEKGKDLKSVECFDIERNSWRELPSMNEERYQATAVAC